MRTENQWKAALRRAFEECGAVPLSLHGHAMQAPGWPDLWVGHSLWRGWIELKAWTGKLSAAQRIIGRRLERSQSFVVLRASEDWRVVYFENSAGDRFTRVRPVWLLDAPEILRVTAEVTT